MTATVETSTSAPPRPAAGPRSPVTTATRSHRGATGLQFLKTVLGVAFTAALIIFVWWAAVTITDVEQIVAPSPGDVYREIVDNPDVYITATMETLRTAGVGLILGVSAGTGLAVAKWWSRSLAGVVEWPTLFMRSVPIVAVVPVMASVVGYGDTTTLIIAGIISFFPSFALVDSGMRTRPPGGDDLFRVLGSARRERLLRLALPAAVPNAATALRLSVTICVLGGMATEYITGTGGLGGLFAASRISYMHPARGWSVAVITAVLSFAAFGVASAVEKRARARFAPL